MHTNMHTAVLYTSNTFWIQETDIDLFSGEFWVGQKVVDLGLADAVGDLWSVVTKRYLFIVVCHSSVVVDPFKLLLLYVRTEKTQRLTSSEQSRR